MKRTQTFTLAALALLAISGRVAAISGPAGPERQNSAVAEHFHSGQKALREGNFAEAVREFHEVLGLDPGLPEAEINLGLAYHLQGDYKLAAEELEKGLEQTPGVVGANIVLGIDQLRLGFAGRAITPLKRALRADPSNKQALRTLAEAFVAQGDYLEASRTYRTLFHDENSGANRWLGLGEAYLRMSSRLTTLMARNDNDTVWAYRLAGDLLSARRLWNDAARKYRLALVRDPSQPGLHASLGDALLEDGKLQEAELEYRNALKLDPSSPRALLGLAQIELERNRGDEALRYVSKVAAISLLFLANQADFPKVNLSPALAAELAGGLVNEKSQPGARFLLAALYRIAGEGAQASQEQAQFQLEASRSANKPAAEEQTLQPCNSHHFEECIQRLEGQPDIDARQYLMLGTALFALRRYERASDALASALALQKQNVQTTYWLIRAYSTLSDDCFSRLTASFPNSAQAHEVLAESYNMKGAEDEAIRQYQFALAKEPGNASLYEALGAIFLKENRLREAQQAIQNALAINPARPRSLYLMGRIALGRQQAQAAIGYLQKALRYEPDMLEARASLGIAYLRARKPALAIPQLQESASLDTYGDLHYMLYQAYQALGQRDLARNALAISQAMRRKTETRDQALIRSAEGNANMPLR